MSDSLKPLKFFVIDDDDTFRTRLVDAIIGRGFKALGFSDGQSALSLNQSEEEDQSPPDRIILDLRLSEESGLDLLPELLKKYPESEILLLTGFGSIATAVEAMKRGAKYFLTKPVGLNEILQAFSESELQEKAPDSDIPSLNDVEWEHIQRVMTLHDGNVTHAAKALGLHRRSLQRKLARGNT